MTTPWRHSLTVCGVVLAMLAFQTPANAFFTFGLFDQDGAGFNLTEAKWRYRDFDRNRDADVAGPDDGIVITLESGEGGWTVQEQQVIRQAFEVWEAVPSSYAAFTFGPPLPQDRLPDTLSGAEGFVFGTNLLQYDTFNFVGSVDGIEFLPPGVLGITLISYIEQTEVIEINGQFVEVSGPGIVDVDIAIDRLFHTVDDTIVTSPEGAILQYPLFGTIVHEAGHLLGMAHNPMNNLELVDVGTLGLNVADPRVLAQRVPGGNIELVGVTPTMFPFAFLNEQDGGLYDDGQATLAPDDIAGITHLYPRDDLSNFFGFEQEARTTAPDGIPSSPVPGAFIQAWADVDDDPATPRVPLFATMTSLYTSLLNPEYSGRFEFINMYKLLQSPNGGFFDATYTFTFTAGAELPGGIVLPMDNYDSTHLGTGGYPKPTEVLEQTFREGQDNIYSVERPGDGTAFQFDPVRSKMVSVATGRTIDQILPGTRPMFGTSVAETVCFLNIAGDVARSGSGSSFLRGVRDTVLVDSAVGAALIDLHYRMSPAVRGYLLERPTLLHVAGAAMTGFGWVVAHAEKLLAAGIALLVLLLALYRRRRSSAAAGLLLVLGLGLFAAPTAEARLAYLPLETMVSESDEIVMGTVVADETRQLENGALVTDVTVKVEDAVKGASNRDGMLHFTQIGGELNGLHQFTPALPKWNEGERVFVFMSENQRFGHLPVGGAAGKFAVHVDPDTGKGVVHALHPYGGKAMVEAMKRRDGEEADDAGEADAHDHGHGHDHGVPREAQAGMPLEEFTAVVRQIVEEQEAEGTQAP